MTQGNDTFVRFAVFGYQSKYFLTVLFPFGGAETAYSKQFLLGGGACIGYFQQGSLGQYPIGTNVL